MNWFIDKLRTRPLITAEELARLRTIEALARKMVEQLEDAKVDYDLLRELKKVIDG